MAWTNPSTAPWANGYLVNATDFNTHVRDNLLFLGGTTGVLPAIHMTSPVVDSGGLTVTSGTVHVGTGGVNANNGIEVQFGAGTSQFPLSVLNAAGGLVLTGRADGLVSVGGQLSVGGVLSVTGAATLSSTLGVSGLLTASSGATLGGALVITSGGFGVTGNSSVSGSMSATSYITTSTARAKRNVRTLDRSALDTVLALRPVSFLFTPEFSDGPHTHLGFIAEEVDGVLPEIVRHNEAGDAESLAYGELIPVFAAAIQELTARLAAVEAR